MSKFKYYFLLFYLFVFCAHCFKLRIFISDAHNLILLNILNLVIIIVFCSATVLMHPRMISFSDPFICYSLLITIFMFLPNILACIRDGRPLMGGLYKSVLILAIFVYIPLKNYFRTPEDFRKVFDAVRYVFLAFLIFAILAAFTGLKRFMAYDNLEMETRLGLQRIGMSTFFGYSTVLFLFYYLKRFVHFREINAFIPLCMILVYLLFVYMGRRLILAVFLTFLLYALINIKIWGRIILLTICFLFFVVTASLFLPQFSIVEHIESFIGLYDTDEANIKVRIDGAEFFQNEYKRSHGWGCGDTSITYEEGSSGSSQKYNPADLGIIATLYVYGIPALLVTIFVSLHIVIMLIRSQKRYNGTPYSALIPSSILLFYLCYSISLQGFYYYRASAIFWGFLFYFVHMIQQENIISGSRFQNFQYRRLEKDGEISR